MRRLIKSVVAELAEGITECSDGAEALAAYRQPSPDWVLMDVEMPVMDGIAATRQIIAGFPEAKIIVTKHEHDKRRATATEAGACAYVLKEDLFALRALIDFSSLTSLTVNVAVHPDGRRRFYAACI